METNTWTVFLAAIVTALMTGRGRCPLSSFSRSVSFLARICQCDRRRCDARRKL